MSNYPKSARQQFCHVDRMTRIVMRQRKAVQLGIVEFAIFFALHHDRRANKVCTTHQLYERIYNGVIDCPSINVVTQTIWQTNRKLKHLGLKIVGTNRRQNSFYRLVVL